jgi:hypothetical protein
MDVQSQYEYGTDEWVDDMFNHIKKAAVEFMKEDGEVMPVILGFTPEPKSLILPMLCKDEFEKRMFLQKVKSVFVEEKVDRYFMVTEAWAVEAKREGFNREDLPDSLEHAPGRIEIVMVQYTGYAFTKTVRMEIERDASGKFTGLGEEKVIDTRHTGLESTGRMLELLPSVEFSEFIS